MDVPGPEVSEYRDPEGRLFHYVLVPNPSARDLVVHFSAFFGEWGNARPYRHAFKGYFHRLRFLGDSPDHNWLFMCDEYGADHNGTYYTGAGGDLFVERATQRIIEQARDEIGTSSERIVTMGSSMGGTAALKFGLRLRVRGIIAVCPHIDLDISAARQDRWRHVAFICPDGDPVGAQNWAYTRQVRRMLDAWEGGPPPRLFVQSCADDKGVHQEQVLPLVDTWRRKGGQVDLDQRPTGGHTSDWATRPLLLDATARILASEDIDLHLYRAELPFLGTLTRDPLSHQLRRRASLTRKRVMKVISRAAGPP